MDTSSIWLDLTCIVAGGLIIFMLWEVGKHLLTKKDKK